MTSAEETFTQERIGRRVRPDSVFDEGGVASIFLFMLDKGEICLDDLKKVRGAHTHKKAVLERMVDLGYATFTPQERPNVKYLYNLTDAGKTVARLYGIIGSIGKESEEA